MNSRTATRTSTAHHPRVQRGVAGGWTWACSCGGASCRTTREALPWRQAFIGALNHAATVVP
ncbi:MAG TPA: hypothetical protein VFX00_14040 [Pedococcus sp.]|nr:hypothetical protein [Pedococcus sp.]